MQIECLVEEHKIFTWPELQLQIFCFKELVDQRFQYCKFENTPNFCIVHLFNYAASFNKIVFLATDFQGSKLELCQAIGELFLPINLVAL